MAKGLTVIEAGQRLSESGFANTERYRRGVSGKGSRWVGAASAAEANFKTGMSEFMAKGSLAKAIQDAGSQAYQTGVDTKGVNNWGPGMSLGAPKYQSKVAKYAALWNAPLATPHGAKRSAANQSRMIENKARFEAAKGK